VTTIWIKQTLPVGYFLILVSYCQLHVALYGTLVQKDCREQSMWRVEKTIDATCEVKYYEEKY
jgi:hypothetical protein